MQQTTHRAHYAVRLETFWSELCLNLEYQEQLYMQCLGCESMEVVRNDGDTQTGVKRALRFRKPIDAPAAIRKMFGNSVTMEEEGTYDPASQTYAFQFRPPMLGDRFSITGLMRVQPTDAGVEVVTDTKFQCNMLGLGGLLERFAVSSAKEGTEDKRLFTERYIAERGLT